MLVAAGGIGGIVAFLGMIVIIARGIFRQVNATEDNTVAIDKLTEEVKKLTIMYNGHDTRIAVLEDRNQREQRPK